MLSRSYCPTGDLVVGVASVLLLLGALVPEVELFMLFCSLEFSKPVRMPLSELLEPGMP